MEAPKRDEKWTVWEEKNRLVALHKRLVKNDESRLFRPTKAISFTSPVKPLSGQMEASSPIMARGLEHRL
jgi:hypothetical protein